MIDHSDPDILGYVLGIRRKCGQPPIENDGVYPTCAYIADDQRCYGCNLNGTFTEDTTIELESVDHIEYMGGIVPMEPELRVHMLWGEAYRSPSTHYDANYGDDIKCRCGDPYYRHFDTYDEMRPVGCKYCLCASFVRD